MIEDRVLAGVEIRVLHSTILWFLLFKAPQISVKHFISFPVTPPRMNTIAIPLEEGFLSNVCVFPMKYPRLDMRPSPKLIGWYSNSSTLSVVRYRVDIRSRSVGSLFVVLFVVCKEYFIGGHCSLSRSLNEQVLLNNTPSMSLIQ